MSKYIFVAQHFLNNHQFADAWVTLATNDSYSLGALVLAHSLKRAGTIHQLAVLITPGVSNAMRCVSRNPVKI